MSELITFMRAFPAQFEQKEPRQITGRLVPYNVATDVLDLPPNGTPDLYREGFRPGAFAGQVSTRNKGVFTKIGLIHRHEGGLGYLGPFTALREQPDGLYGDARILPMHEANVAALLDAGVDELSIEFRLRGSQPTSIDDDGVRWRVSAHLDQVALEPKGAYSTAQVLAFRSERDVLEVEESEREQTEADEQAKLSEEQEALEAEAAEALARRQRWDVLSGRYDDEAAKQRQIIERYGLTSPGGFRRA